MHTHFPFCVFLGAQSFVENDELQHGPLKEAGWIHSRKIHPDQTHEKPELLAKSFL